MGEGGGEGARGLEGLCSKEAGVGARCHAPRRL